MLLPSAGFESVIFLAIFLGVCLFIAGMVIGAALVWNWHRSIELTARLDKEHRQKVGP